MKYIKLKVMKVILIKVIKEKNNNIVLKSEMTQSFQNFFFSSNDIIGRNEYMIMIILNYRLKNLLKKVI